MEASSRLPRASKKGQLSRAVEYDSTHAYRTRLPTYICHKLVQVGARFVRASKLRIFGRKRRFYIILFFFFFQKHWDDLRVLRAVDLKLFRILFYSEDTEGIEKYYILYKVSPDFARHPLIADS